MSGAKFIEYSGIQPRFGLAHRCPGRPVGEETQIALPKDKFIRSLPLNGAAVRHQRRNPELKTQGIRTKIGIPWHQGQINLFQFSRFLILLIYRYLLPYRDRIRFRNDVQVFALSVQQFHLPVDIGFYVQFCRFIEIPRGKTVYPAEMHRRIQGRRLVVSHLKLDNILRNGKFHQLSFPVVGLDTDCRITDFIKVQKCTYGNRRRSRSSIHRIDRYPLRKRPCHHLPSFIRS